MHCLGLIATGVIYKAIYDKVDAIDLNLLQQNGLLRFKCVFMF